MPPKQQTFFSVRNDALKNGLETFTFTNKEGITKTYERFQMNKGLFSYRLQK